MGTDNTWLIGVALMSVGSIMNNLGNNLMSLGHQEQREIDTLILQRTNSKEGLLRDSHRPETPEGQNAVKEFELIDAELEKKKEEGTWWLTGTIIFVIGALLAFVSFGFAAQSLLAALESIQFISNVFFHKYVHGLEITNRILYSTLCIVFGNVLVVMFSSHKSEKLTAREVTEIYETNTAYHIYLILSGLIWFASHGMYLYYQEKRRSGQAVLNHSRVEAFVFIVSATLIGTQSVLHAKCLSMLMLLCIAKDDQFATFHAGTVWAVLFSWIITAAIYIHRINRGLELYAPTFFIPTMTVCFAFFTMVCGGIFFSEFQQLSTLAITMFTLGTLMIFGGVNQLEASPSTSVQPVDEDEMKKLENSNHDSTNGDVEAQVSQEKVNTARTVSDSGMDVSNGNDSDRERRDSKPRRTSLLPHPSTMGVAIENRDLIRSEVIDLAQNAGASVKETLNRLRASSGENASSMTKIRPSSASSTSSTAKDEANNKSNKIVATDDEVIETLDTGGTQVEETNIELADVENGNGTGNPAGLTLNTKDNGYTEVPTNDEQSTET